MNVHAFEITSNKDVIKQEDIQFHKLFKDLPEFKSLIDLCNLPLKPDELFIAKDLWDEIVAFADNSKDKTNV